MSTTDSRERSEHPWMHCTAGVMGGAMATMLFYPLDFLRTRMHTIRKDCCKKPLSCSVRQIIQAEGFRGMYRGIGVSVASHSIGWGLYLLTFHSAQRQIADLLQRRGYEECSASTRDFASACVAATTTGTILTPLNLLKTRRQLNKGNQGGCRSIIKQEGWKSLFKGIAPQIVLTGNTTIQVTLYEFLRRRFFTNTDTPSPWQVAMASAVSKAVSSALFNPLEVVRTRLQAHHSQGFKEYQGMMDGLATIWRMEGIAGMYRGLPVNVARVIPSTVFAFVAYEKCLCMLSEAHEFVRQWTIATVETGMLGRPHISW